MHIHKDEIKRRCDELCATIERSNARLESLREICKHEDTHEVDYSWRPGCVHKAIACDYCDDIIRVPDLEFDNMSKAYDEAYEEMIKKQSNK